MQTEFFALNTRDRDGTNARLATLRSEGYWIIGVEVTDAAFESRLHTNFDPQHRDSGSELAACQAVWEALNAYDEWNVQGFDFVRSLGRLALVTSKFDLDSLAGMALLYWAQQGLFFSADFAFENRLAQIAQGDSFKTARWQAGGLPASAREAFGIELQALAHACEKIQFTDPQAAVKTVASWLATGWFIGKIEATREVLEVKASALAVSAQLYFGGAIAYVESTQPFATSVAYREAPIGVCFNPNFRGVEKYTICEWGDDLTRVDFKALVSALNEREQSRWPEGLNGSWGGQGKIIGSPFGVSSRISRAEVLDLVARHIKTDSCCYPESCDTEGNCLGCGRNWR